jgi:hypothetical protein
MAYRGAQDWSSTRSVQRQTPVKGTYFLLPLHALVCVDIKGIQ